MKNRTQINKAFLLLTFALFTVSGALQAQNTWTLESQEDWQANIATKSNLEISKGKVIPTEKEAVFKAP